MADNTDKQNDIQLKSDNNDIEDKPIADKDRDQMNIADDHNDHKDADEDTQDVKSSDMVWYDSSLITLFALNSYFWRI